MSESLASLLRPVAEPRVFDDAYSDDQYRRLIGVVRRKGPWQVILAQHFKSAEEVVATMAGAMPEGVTPTFDMFLSPNFRGYFAQDGVCLYPELEDFYPSARFRPRGGRDHRDTRQLTSQLDQDRTDTAGGPDRQQMPPVRRRSWRQLQTVEEQLPGGDGSQWQCGGFVEVQ